MIITAMMYQVMSLVLHAGHRVLAQPARLPHFGHLILLSPNSVFLKSLSGTLLVQAVLYHIESQFRLVLNSAWRSNCALEPGAVATRCWHSGSLLKCSDNECQHGLLYVLSQPPLPGLLITTHNGQWSDSLIARSIPCLVGSRLRSHIQSSFRSIGIKSTRRENVD